MRHVIVLAAALAVLAPGRARADSDSLFAIGVGTGLGVAHTGPNDAGTTAVELKARLRLLRGIGLELGYDPTVAAQATVAGTSYRASLLLHIIPTYPLGAYLKGGC